MGWKTWQQKGKKLLSSATLEEPFHVLTITILSLLLPLSFLLLARLSGAHYLLDNTPLPRPCSPIFSLYLYTNPTLIHVLVSTVSVATLVHGLTVKISLLSESPGPAFRPHLYTAWIFLCTLQVCVGLGIEGFEESLAAGIESTGLANDRSSLSKVIFFLGLHETMLHWSRTVVKPVVDDTVYGVARDERWIEKVAMAAGFGTLWWLRLRDEVEFLVIMAEAKKELLMGVWLADFFGWGLYYLTVTIGMVRLVKCLMCLGMVLCCRRPQGNAGDPREDEEKV